MASGTGTPYHFIAVPAIAMVRPSMEPTDRSRLREVIRKVIPTPMTVVTAAARATFSRLSEVRKRSWSRAKATMKKVSGSTRRWMRFTTAHADAGPDAGRSRGLPPSSGDTAFCPVPLDRATSDIR